MQNTVVRLTDVAIAQGAHQVLEKVNFKVTKGEFVYLIGKTGSGKSSLLKTLYAALSLQHGKGEVAGFDLAKMNRKTIPHLRRKLGIIFQDFNLLMDRTVAENLNFALKVTGWKEKNLREQRIQEVLKQVDLVHKTNAMPHALSGGERQRVAIARALLNTPKLIIADEPTGNLDPETSDDILLLLRRLAQHHDTAVLFATHDYRILENFPARIVRCHAGKVFDEEDLMV